MLRREFSGSVNSTLLASNISNSSTSITLTSGSSFPTGSMNPFVVILSRGDNNEEKVLISSRSGDVLLVDSRGYDGTVANSHITGAVVDHVLDATTIQDMNTTVYDTAILAWMEI